MTQCTGYLAKGKRIKQSLGIIVLCHSNDEEHTKSIFYG